MVGRDYSAEFVEAIVNLPDWAGALLAVAALVLLLSGLRAALVRRVQTPSVVEVRPSNASTTVPLVNAPLTPVSDRTPPRARSRRLSADEDRSVRVFVSSTFLDMQEERDVLVTGVFPALRAKYRERGVEIFEVDLRWGITAEQQERGDTLPILLAEIDRCRPYFIGLIGDRYGWVPEQGAFRPELVEQYPLLADAAGLSITAIEFLHALSSRSAHGAQSIVFERTPGWNWKAKLDPNVAASASEEGEAARAKLTSLKKMARVHTPLIAFSDPQHLRQLVFDKLDAWLDQRFPAASTPDPFDQIALLHRAYARDRRVVHIGAERCLQALDRWARADEGPPMLVTGLSGAGKSALIANWAEAWRVAHPDAFVLEHYVGASAESAEPPEILKRIWAEVNAFTGQQVAPPSGEGTLSDFGKQTAERLAAVADASPFAPTVIIDGLDKLSDPEWLGWIPVAKGVRLLASSLQGPAYDSVRAQGFAELVVEPLSKTDRYELVERTLMRWRRALTPDHIEALLKPNFEELAGSPLYLKTVLEELRVSADNARLRERLDDYRAANDMLDLFDRVLARLEDDCGEGFVREVLPLIWASRGGLEETEILAITGKSPLAWATLRYGLGDNLRDQIGRVTFGHDYLRQAVERRYLPDEEAKRRTHAVLARRYHGSFKEEAAAAAAADKDVARYEKTKDGAVIFRFLKRTRSRTQLLLHMQEAGDWSGIAALLTDDTFFAALPPAAYGADWDHGPIVTDKRALHPRHLFLLEPGWRIAHAFEIARAFARQASKVREQLQAYPKSGRSASLGIPTWAETARRLKDTSPREFGLFRDSFYSFKRLMVLASDWLLVTWDGSDRARERVKAFSDEFKDASSLHWLLNEYGREMTGLSGAIEDNACGDGLLGALMTGAPGRVKVDFHERVAFLGATLTRGRSPTNAIGPGAAVMANHGHVSKLLRRACSAVLLIADEPADVRISSDNNEHTATSVSIAAQGTLRDAHARLAKGLHRYDLFVVDLIARLYDIEPDCDLERATVRLTLPTMPV